MLCFKRGGHFQQIECLLRRSLINQEIRLNIIGNRPIQLGIRRIHRSERPNEHGIGPIFRLIRPIPRFKSPNSAKIRPIHQPNAAKIQFFFLNFDARQLRFLLSPL